MCQSMADIQSATAEIRRGKKRKKIEEETTGQKYNGLPYLHMAAIETSPSTLRTDPSSDQDAQASHKG